MMFASVVGHHAHGIELSRRLLKSEYNASKILKFLKTKNPNYYPVPMQPDEIQNREGAWIPERLSEGYLTEDDFCELYDKTCGKMLHAQRLSKFDINHDDLVAEADIYLVKLVALLNVHWVHFNEDYAFRVGMRDVSTGSPNISLMQAVENRK